MRAYERSPCTYIPSWAGPLEVFAGDFLPLKISVCEDKITLGTSTFLFAAFGIFSRNEASFVGGSITAIEGSVAVYNLSKLPVSILSGHEPNYCRCVLACGRSAYSLQRTRSNWLDSISRATDC